MLSYWIKIKIMKISIVSILFVLGLLVVNISFAQSIEVLVTRDKADVADMVKGEELYSKHSKLYGSSNKIRKIAIEKLKVVAVEKGYDAVLIVKDEFGNTPINNVNLVAIGYKKKE